MKIYSFLKCVEVLMTPDFFLASEIHLNVGNLMCFGFEVSALGF